MKRAWTKAKQVWVPKLTRFSEDEAELIIKEAQQKELSQNDVVRNQIRLLTVKHSLTVKHK